MKHHLFIVGALVVLAVLSGCRTTDDIPLLLDRNEAIYISPGIEDGINDAVTIGLVVTPFDRTRIVAYSITIRDAGDTIVRSIDENVGPRRLFSGNRRAAVDPPQVVLWDGRDDNGKLVRDGLYRMTASVTDNRGNIGEDGPRDIVVDNTPPVVELSVPFPLFTPNGDGRLESLLVYQRRSTAEDEWQGVIRDGSESVVRRFSWTGAAVDFAWDGRSDAESLAAEGTYTYSIGATDRAGNSARFSVDGLELELDALPASVSASRRAFSPNNDGRADVIAFSVELDRSSRVTAWALDILDVSGASVQTFAGEQAPEEVVFDGVDATGMVIPDGVYRPVLTAEYAGGQEISTAGPPFVSDTRTPHATIATNRIVFSPDGDGAGDTVEILQSSTIELEWVATISAPGGTVEVRRRWEGQVESFLWDGTTDAGSRLEDGTYLYQLSAEDEAMNRTDSVAIPIRIDTSPLEVSISAESREFSPNGDGILDSIPFSLVSQRSEDIESWSVSVRPAVASQGREIASGRRLPRVFNWDGTLAGVTQRDGRYVAALEITFSRGTVVRATSPAVRLDTVPPRLSLNVSPALFSPDDDGTDDLLQVAIAIRDAGSIQGWTAELYDRENHPFMSWSGAGSPTEIVWDGRSTDGELVQSAQLYSLKVSATDSVWNTGTSTAEIPVDVLVIREDDRYRIRVSSIYFVPFSADYLNVPQEQATENLATLNRLAEVMARFPNREIRVEGHAVQIYWNDRARAAREQTQVLLPLSGSRAEAIKDGLVERGIAESRISTFGYGGAIPVVPHSDVENRWKNRRVEFVLVPR